MPTVLSAIIETARVNKDLTQHELGKLVGRGQQAIQKWESGETKPPPKVLAAASVALGLPTEILMYEADYLEPPDTHYWSDDIRVPQNLGDGLFIDIVLDRADFNPDEVTPVEEPSRTRRKRPGPTPADIADLRTTVTKGYVDGVEARLTAELALLRQEVERLATTLTVGAGRPGALDREALDEAGREMDQAMKERDSRPGGAATA